MPKSNLSIPLLLALGGGAALLIMSRAEDPRAKVPLTSSFQTEIVAVMQALGVDTAGHAQGPFTISAVSRATALADQLALSGYPEAAALIRGYVAAATLPLIPG